MKDLPARDRPTGSRRRQATHRRILVAAGLILAGAQLGCAVGVDAGPVGDDGIGYVGGYYEPYGYVVGGWGGGYHVGPGRGGERGGRGGAGHSYRSAPAGRGAPSIPSHSRRR
jgi:hypothetical protein